MSGHQYTPSHRPVGFDLHTLKDEDQFPVLFIESYGDGDTLELAVSNSSDQTIRISALVAQYDQASVENYHLQMRFRNRVLADSFINNKLDQSLRQLTEWNSWYGPDPDPLKREYIISLVWKGSEPLSIKKGEMFTVPIAGVSAEPSGGARNSRVQIRYDHFTYADGKPVPKGHQMQHMEIVNRVGLKTIPLVAGFAGSRTVINDGNTPNTRTIFIHNPSKGHGIDLSNKLGQKTEFILQIPVKDLEEKGEQSVRAALSANSSIGLHFAEAMAVSAGFLEWTLTAESKQRIEAGEQIEINITDWKTSFHTGMGNLYLHYQNIPGYQDGTFAIPIEYGPTSSVPVGAILAYGGETPPTGWLFCDGSVIPSDLLYDALRSVVGNYVPDLRSRFIVGAGQGQGRRSYGWKEQDGDETHKLTINEMPSHTHTVNQGNFWLHYRSFDGDDDDDKVFKDIKHNGGTPISNVDSSGGNQPHNNLPPYYALIYIIKY
jgi:microcystin-dependent protein